MKKSANLVDKCKTQVSSQKETCCNEENIPKDKEAKKNKRKHSLKRDA